MHVLNKVITWFIECTFHWNVIVLGQVVAFLKHIKNVDAKFCQNNGKQNPKRRNEVKLMQTIDRGIHFG